MTLRPDPADLKRQILARGFAINLSIGPDGHTAARAISPLYASIAYVSADTEDEAILLLAQNLPEDREA